MEERLTPGGLLNPDVELGMDSWEVKGDLQGLKPPSPPPVLHTTLQVPISDYAINWTGWEDLGDAAERIWECWRTLRPRIALQVLWQMGQGEWIATCCRLSPTGRSREECWSVSESYTTCLLEVAEALELVEVDWRTERWRFRYQTPELRKKYYVMD